jgi:hypothetical protein
MERRITRREGDREQTPSVKPGAAADAVRPGSLAWASAVGNHAVQRLARQPDEHEHEEEEGAVGAAGPVPGAEAEEAPPPEVEALQGAGIGHEGLAGLAAVDQLGEDALPE